MGRKVVVVVLALVALVACSGTLQRAVVQGKRRVPAHEEVTPAGPGYCCAFDLDMKWDCGMHMNCPEERRSVPEACWLTVKGDGCVAEEVAWPCTGFDGVDVGQVVTAAIRCEPEPTRAP